MERHSYYQSQRIAEHVEQANWKPIFFSPLYVLSLTALHLLHIIGIQLLIDKHGSDWPEIGLVQQNNTITNPQSIFIFDEEDVGAFLAWQYLPVAIATVLGCFWESLDVAARRLQPFCQMSGSNGGNIDNSLCLEYTSMFGLLVPFSSWRKRHYAVSVTSLIYVLTTILIPTLTGGIWSIEWASLSYSSEKIEGPKWATITVNPGVAVATQVFHGVILGLGILATIILFFQRTGLYRDPIGIAGIASLIADADRSDSNILRLFRQLPSFAHSKVVASSLREVTFYLRHMPVIHPNGTISTTYQLTTDAQLGAVLPLYPRDREFSQDRFNANGIWLSKRALLLVECFFWLCQAAIASAVYSVAKLVGPDGFADSAKPTIAKMTFTFCITLGGMMWASIQRDVQLFETWRQISGNHTRDLCESLLRSDVLSFGLLGSALLSIAQGSLVMLWASFCVIMVQVATVFLPPIFELVYAAGLVNQSPFRRHEFGIVNGTKGLVFGATAIAIHLVIFFNMLFLMLKGRTRPFLPRAPKTIASQILYLCRSDKLLADFAGTSMVSGKDLADRLKRVDRQCLFGWFWWQRGHAWYVGVEEYDQSWQPFDFNMGTQGFSICT